MIYFSQDWNICHLLYENIDQEIYCPASVLFICHCNITSLSFHQKERKYSNFSKSVGMCTPCECTSIVFHYNSSLTKKTFWYSKCILRKNFFWELKDWDPLKCAKRSNHQMVHWTQITWMKISEFNIKHRPRP